MHRRKRGNDMRRRQREELSAREADQARIYRQAERERKRAVISSVSPLRTGVRIFSIVLVVVLITAALLLMFLPEFYIEGIELTGTTALSVAEVGRAAGIETGTHVLTYLINSPESLFTFRARGVEERLRRAYPFFADIEAKVLIPGKISIKFTEAKPVGYMRLADEYVILDVKGTALSFARTVPAGIPRIEGILPDDVKLGEQLDDDSRRRFVAAIVLLDAILSSDSTADDGVRLFSLVDSVRSTDGVRHYLSLRLNNDELRWIRFDNLDINLAEDITWLRYAYKSGQLDELGAGIVCINERNRFFRPLETLLPMEESEEATEASTEESTEPPPTEAPTDPPTEAPTEAPTDPPTEAPTEAPTDPPTEAPTEAPTDLPTEAPTEAPTDPPTEVPTEAPTEEGTESASEASTEEISTETSPETTIGPPT
ncbi:MAG: hypothetical protein GX907_05335 [Clostridiaceae bacterium]|nr:hypothetical protein [Clostridiaceae bacterium]